MSRLRSCKDINRSSTGAGAMGFASLNPSYVLYADYPQASATGLAPSERPGLTTDSERATYGLAETAPDLRISLLAVADERDLNVLARWRVDDKARELRRMIDVLAVEGDDDIARRDAGRLGRSLLLNADDEHAPSRRDSQLRGNVV